MTQIIPAPGTGGSGNAGGSTPFFLCGFNDNLNAPPEDLASVAGGGLYVPPTEARIHDIVSTSANDSGTLKTVKTGQTQSTFTADASVVNVHEFTLMDSTGEYTTFGIAAGQYVLNDTKQDYALIKGAPTPTTLTIYRTNKKLTWESGDSYRIVEAGPTGAAFVEITQGVDANIDSAGEFIVLNGTTNVPTINSYKRLNKMVAIGVGSTGTNAGSITATAQVDLTVSAEIQAALGESYNAFFTVPRGKQAYLTSVVSDFNDFSSPTTGAVTISLLRRDLIQTGTGGVGSGTRLDDCIGGSIDASVNSRVYVPEKPFPEYTDFWIRAQAVTGVGTALTATMTVKLFDL